MIMASASQVGEEIESGGRGVGRMSESKVAQTMWSLERPGYNVMSNVVDIARGEMAGYNVRSVGKVRELFPRLSQADYERIQQSQLPEVDGGMDSLLSGMVGMSGKCRRSIMDSRKVAVQTMADGSARYVVVPVVGEVVREVDVLNEEQGYDELAEYVVPSAADLAARSKTRKYTVDQIFNDQDTMVKYQFPLRVLETAKRQAVSNPAAAAKLLQDYMNAQQSVVSVRVTAPKGQLNKSLAATTLKTVGAQYDRVEVSVEAEVAMDVLVMYGPAGVNDWHVRGPLKYANEISYVYWMMFHEGLVVPNILFSVELVLLGIDVFDGKSSQEPELLFHAGVGGYMPMGLSLGATADMTSAQRASLQDVALRLLPVMSSSGDQMATAVQVTGKHAIVNAHVVAADPLCTIADSVLHVKVQLSRDVLCVSSVRDSPPWVLRPPVVSEWVIICYVTGGQLSCTSPVQLVSVAEEVLVLTMDSTVGPGFSGGAVVAASDFALLGIHSGATRNNLLAYKFGDRQFADLLDGDSVSAISRADDAGEFAGKTIEYFKNRGLGRVFQSAVDSLVPVFVDNMHVGTAVRVSGRVYTACDTSRHLTFGSDRRVMVLERMGKTQVYSAEDGTSSSSPAYRRMPTYYESVTVVGFDGEPYMTVSTEVAHIAPNHSSFVIRDIPTADRPLAGGFVLAFDGAFLGVCGPRRVDTAIGVGYTCWPIREDASTVPGPREVVGRAFPFLNVSAWPSELLEEVFTHSSVGKYESGRVFNAGCKPLANIGDNVLKALLWAEYRKAALPHAMWQTRMQAIQNNAFMSQVAWQHGLGKALVVGMGASLPRDSKAYADMVEAFIGAASLVEKPEVVRVLALTTKLIEVPETHPVMPAPSYFSRGDSEAVRMPSSSDPLTPAVD